MPFAMLCQAWARYRKQQERLDKAENDPESSSIERRREQMIANKYWSEVMALAGRFGLTASDRGRLSLPERKQADPFADFLSQGREAKRG